MEQNEQASRCAGEHTGFAAPDEPGDRFGRPGEHVNGDLLGELAASAYDGCGPCQRRRLDEAQDDPLTATRLVELAGVAVAGMAGGLPAGMIAETGLSTFSAPFRAALRAGVDQEDHQQMYAVVAGLDRAQRRAALEDALDMLTGVMAAGD